MTVSRGIAVSLFAFGLALVASATDFHWIGGGGDNYITTAANWSLTSGGTPCDTPPNNAVGSEDVLVFSGIGGTLWVTNGTDNAAMNYAGYRFEGSSTGTVCFRSAVNLGAQGIVSTGKQKSLFYATINLFAGTNVIDNAAQVRYGIFQGPSTGAAILLKRGAGELGTSNESTAKTGASKNVDTLILSGGSFWTHNTTETFGKVVWDGGGMQLYGTTLTFPNGFEVTERGKRVSTNYAINRYSSAGKTLTVNGTGSSFSGNFTTSNGDNAFNLTWTPTSKTDEFVWTRGAFGVNANSVLTTMGVMRFAECAKVTKGKVTVAADAEFIVDSTAGLFVAVPFTLSGTTSKLTIRGKDTFLPVSSITVNGTAIPEGVYRAGVAEFDWLDGEGWLLVNRPIANPAETTEATWTGAGGDTLLTTAANWENATLPDLTEGTCVATFPDGATVTVPEAPEDNVFYRLKGVVGAGALTLTAESANAAPFLLGPTGLVTAAALTLSADVVLADAQTWTFGAASEFTADGHVRALDRTKAWTLDGKALTIRSTNGCLPNSVTTKNVINFYADNAIGGRYTTVSSSTRNYWRFYEGHTYDSAFSNSDNVGGDSATDVTFMTIYSGDVVFNGLVKATGMNRANWHFDTGHTDSSVTFNGGYEYSAENNNAAFSPLHRGTITYAEVPFNVTRVFFGYNYNYRQVVNLNVAGNVTTRGVHLLESTVLNANVEGALKATDTGSSGITLNGNTIFNLAADQGVNILNGRAKTARVTSANGATLLLRDDRLNTAKSSESKTLNGGCISLYGEQVKTNLVAFTGNVNFTKAGALDHYLLGTSTSTGTLTVTGGRLAFLEDGSWTAATKAVVSGAGRLALRRGDLGKEVALEVDTANGAKIEIAEGQKVRCASLTVNGVPQETGVYTGDAVTGGGQLFVGCPGLMLFLR